jgi:hypothetical protein
MKNTPSISSHESIFLPKTHELVIHADVEIHEEIPKEDNNIVTRKSKRRRVAKSFGEHYIIYLVDDTPTTIAEAYSSLTLTYGRKLFKVRWILLYLMELGKWFIVLMDANLWGVYGSSKRSLGLMVLLRSTRQG